ncbi:MAG: hypothetical protein M3384_20290 [Acidobacteriota bacterium]|nr:hypothetical protein [Acidobacteriota bacterium]
MAWKVFVGLILAFALFSSGCTVLWETSVELLSEKLRWQLKNKQFGEIYDESTDFIHRNISREEFIERTAEIAAGLERVDKDIKWQPNDYLQKTYVVETYNRSTYLKAYKELGEGKEKIIIHMSWEDVNGKMKLSHLWASNSQDAERPFNILAYGKIVKSK